MSHCRSFCNGCIIGEQAVSRGDMSEHWPSLSVKIARLVDSTFWWSKSMLKQDDRKDSKIGGHQDTTPFYHSRPPICVTNAGCIISKSSLSWYCSTSVFAKSSERSMRLSCSGVRPRQLGHGFFLLGFRNQKDYKTVEDTADNLNNPGLNDSKLEQSHPSIDEHAKRIECIFCNRLLPKWRMKIVICLYVSCSIRKERAPLHQDALLSTRLTLNRVTSSAVIDHRAITEF